MRTLRGRKLFSLHSCGNGVRASGCVWRGYLAAHLKLTNQIALGLILDVCVCVCVCVCKESSEGKVV